MMKKSESDVYDDDMAVSWSTARESPGVTGDNETPNNHEHIK